MPRTAVERRRKCRDARDLVDSDFAKLLHSEKRCRAFTFGSAGPVVSSGVLMHDPRVDDDQLHLGWERYTLVRKICRVDEKRGSEFTDAHAHLIHDPDRRADKVRLGALRVERELDVVEGKAERPSVS